MWVLVVVICNQYGCGVVQFKGLPDDYCRMNSYIINRDYENAVAFCTREYTI